MPLSRRQNRIGGRKWYVPRIGTSTWLQHREQGTSDGGRRVKELNQTEQSSRAQEEHVSLGPHGSGRPARGFQIGERGSRRNVWEKEWRSEDRSSGWEEEPRGR